MRFTKLFVLKKYFLYLSLSLSNCGGPEKGPDTCLSICGGPEKGPDTCLSHCGGPEKGPDTFIPA